MSEKEHYLFKELELEEEAEFRHWAREMYELYTQINTLWHPIIQEECAKMNVEDYRRRHEQIK